MLSASEWPLFLETCRRQAVAPLIWRRIAEQGLAPDIPGPVRAGMKQSYLASEARNLFHFSKLDRITGALGRAGIPVALLKGAHIGRYVYRNPALRPMADIDLLVRPEDVNRALRVMHELGYRGGASIPFKLMRDFHHHAPTLDDGSGVAVEIHWNIVPPNRHFPVDPDDLWRNAHCMEAGPSEKIHLLAPEAVLLSVCAHAAWQHRLSLNSILSLADMDRIARDGVDWQTFLSQASDWRMQRPAYLGLTLIQRFLGSPVPDAVITSLRPEGDTETIEDLAATLLCAASPAVSLSRRAPEALNARNLPKAAQAVFRLMVPHRIQFAYFYEVNPSYTNLLRNYPRWIADLLHRHGRTIWNVLRKDPVTVQAFRTAEKQHALSLWLENSGQGPLTSVQAGRTPAG